MIPSILASEVKRTVLDYLDTTFSFQDDSLSEHLKDFLLNSDEKMFKGPYVSVRLPYRKAEEGKKNLTIFPPFTPYVHQLRSFDRLSSQNQQPKPTLVTTGTGSGKTECFSYPILDYCYHQREAGIKAIVLYPMNALASDQAKRLAEMIHNDQENLGHIRVGMYVGGNGIYKQMGKDHVIDDRDTLRKNPPDILLTNYKMLDYLLIRPEDRQLWQNNEEDMLKYLVLDELHTYDGAQGSDVANLIRRLKARLNIDTGKVAMVGTSATIASEDENSIKSLTDFASDIFGEEFNKDSFILEDRIELDDFLDYEPKYYELPNDLDKLTHDVGESQDSFIRSQMKAWFGKEQMTTIELGTELKQHRFLESMLSSFHNEIIEIDELINKLSKRDPDFASKSNDRQQEIIHSFITLISSARLLDGDRMIPFLQVQVQIWIREMRRLLRKISNKPEFYWKDGNKPIDKVGLPMYYCRECGHSGWLTYPIDGSGPLQKDSTSIYNRFFDKSRFISYIYIDDGEDIYVGDQQQMTEKAFLNPKDLSIQAEQNRVGNYVPVVIREAKVTNTKPPKDRHCCPKCDAEDSVIIAGSQAASLASVAISHLYTSPFNEDKKLLVFTDSVQDASHRASFFENRTYRFNFRTALQTAVESLNGPMTLVELPNHFYNFWMNRFLKDNDIKNPVQHFTATFLPPDLKEEPVYKKFIKSKTELLPDELEVILRRRLSWEITMEYGFSARIGRTLDKVRSSIVYFDPTKIDDISDKFTTLLSGDYGHVSDLGEEKIKQFVLGLLTRVKFRGGIEHEFLSHYRNDQKGNTFLLRKERNKYMSPIGGAVPHFLTDDKNSKNFDSIVTGGNRNSWAVDWMGRSLSHKLSIQDMNKLYVQFVEYAREAGILDKVTRGNISNYGIRPESLYITTETKGIICDKCGYRLTIADDEQSTWIGATCRRYQCRGHYVIDTDERQSFYRNLYSKGHIQRIYTEEHTGLLERSKREEVEHLFKSKQGETYADAPNLLTCTPTLEMGIDVGDLSATMLNSVPPTTANYVQRIGRAGRKTGNSLILTMSKAQKHDLYFYAEPKTMMAGHVAPPGSYLDAPEILKRHFFAYCMDTWARDDHKAKNLPNKVQMMLTQYKKGEFPNTFIKFYEKGKSTLINNFTNLYEGILSASNNEMLQEYVKQNILENSIVHVISKTEKELEKLKKLSSSIRTEMKKLEVNKLVIEDFDIKIKELENERKLVFRMMNEIKEKYPLELFTNEGLLPNYAFPESGIKLKAIIKKRRLNEEEDPYEVFELLRPARSALREFAPYNTFYASRRKILIDQVDTGGLKNPKIEEWKFCNNCSHTELVTESHYKTACPMCGSTAWEDKGQNRQMLKLEYFESKTDEVASSTVDEGDERENIRFHIQHFFDINKNQDSKAFVIDDIPFGYEYLNEVKMKEINFGYQQNLALNNKMDIAGDEVSKTGFRVCKDCGIVEKPVFIEGHKQPRHRYNCKYNQQNQDQKDAWTDVVLYREITSEAIRMLVPVSTTQQSEKLLTFKACLELGLREFYKGNPGHLFVRDHFEPVQGEEHGSRHYLVIYDEVPGGTGYLKNLVETNTFMEVIQKAYDALVVCECQNDDNKDGCYRCLYAYQNQFEIDSISRTQGIELLKQILDQRDKLEATSTLSNVTIDSLVESELEERFLNNFKAYISSLNIDNSWVQTIYQGKQSFEFTFDNENWWRLVPQVELNRDDNVLISSRPDFIFYPINQNSDVDPVTVFLDGFKYHVNPDERRGEIGQDIRKRMAIRDSQKYLVWTLSWDDVEEFSNHNDSQSLLLTPDEVKKAFQYNKALKNPIQDDANSLVTKNKVDQLIMLLKNPKRENWEKFAMAIMFSMLVNRPRISEDYGLTKIREIANSEVKPKIDVADDAPAGDSFYIPKNKFSESDIFKGFFLIPAQQYQQLYLLMKGAEGVLNPKAIEGIIRIEDDFTNRNLDDYKRTWNEFWRLSNLLQFLPNVYQVSRELIEEFGDDLSLETQCDNDMSEEWLERFEIVDESCKAVLHELMDNQTPVPEVGYEVASSQGTLGELELAWEDKKVGVLLDEDEDLLKILKEKHWQVFFLTEINQNVTSLLDSLN
ncbi:DEAD/DEAH box helicase [Aquibacillus albus]|uniref:DEAD/DEAH box helicase domain-containing protein n=1 Tax=Aquibacillus albus TaxID=1168171 RepID=A0ABS2N4A9_9BACI|nr:DEAD/DEAH box helicase [Aquibacillus albus]MBM7572943.1 DEAD/DEAH box helicase domain-containing protein [Aquibacillus albus]